MTDSVSFIKTVRSKYRRYSRAVLGFRHFPAGEDGLKPVQRRALWAMHKLGAVNKPHMAKTSKIVGDTLGNFHPHEDGSISQAVANMTQASMSSPLIIGVGNWGDHIEEPGAIRYTSAYLSLYAMTMFDVDELTCVPMDPTYNGKNKEPRLLPARLPHLLIGGCNSLAPGYRGNIPPCPPEWVAESVTNVIAGKAVRMPKSLDHRWGGQLVSFDESWLDDGTGSASFVPRIKTEHGIVVLTSLAPRLSIDTVETRVQEDPAFAGLTEESSDSELVRIVIRVKRSHNVAEFAQRIRKACLTREHYFFLQISQRTGADGDVEYDPIIEGPRQFLTEWVKWRTSIVVGAARNRITNLKVEIARVDLLLRVIDHRREILRILDQSKSDDDIRNRTVSLLKCTMDQASEVMTIPWSRLARYKSAPLLDKRKHCIKNVTFNETIVSRPRRRLESDVSNAVVSIEESVAEAAYAASFKRTRTKRR